MWLIKSDYESDIWLKIEIYYEQNYILILSTNYML